MSFDENDKVESANVQPKGFVRPAAPEKKPELETQNVDDSKIDDSNEPHHTPVSRKVGHHRRHR